MLTLCVCNANQCTGLQYSCRRVYTLSDSNGLCICPILWQKYRYLCPAQLDSKQSSLDCSAASENIHEIYTFIQSMNVFHHKKMALTWPFWKRIGDISTPSMMASGNSAPASFTIVGKRSSVAANCIHIVIIIEWKYRSSGNFRKRKIFVSHCYYENNKYEN